MANVRRVITLVATIAAAVVIFIAGWTVATLGIGSAADPASLPDQEREFTERMKDASLVGVFTLDGRDDRQPAPDRYDIAGVDKVGENRWRFNMRMRHSTVDVTLPVIVPLQWINGTPTIVMSNYSIPGLGTFSAHVFFDGMRYAGTWQNGAYGGLMYGRIEKQGSNSN
jgi:hypothetical protein